MAVLTKLTVYPVIFARIGLVISLIWPVRATEIAVLSRTIMLKLQPGYSGLFAHLSPFHKSYRRLASALCACLALLAAMSFVQPLAALAVRSEARTALYQTSPLATPTASTEAANANGAATPTNRGGQTSLLLVSIVLIGVLVVVGLVLWRQQ